MILQRGAGVPRANHLFVEGKDNTEIDPVVMMDLLINNELTQIAVSAMGSCGNVRSAAEALISHHPTYYFLIDRDDRDAQTVDESWNNFSAPLSHNMLIWRKRELENYFIDPDYIGKSSFLRENTDIKTKVLIECNRRLFLDAANLTLLRTNRELQKPLRIDHFRKPEDFKNIDDGVLQLKGLTGFEDRRNSDEANLTNSNVTAVYSDLVGNLSGGVFPLQYGSGTWLEQMSGKEIFRSIANECFKVRNRDGQLVIGKEQNKVIAKELVKLPIEQQPEDFQKLVSLLKERVSK
ncbi:MAG: hypothetical protein WAO71_04760 [Gallionella sp.]